MSSSTTPTVPRSLGSLARAWWRSLQPLTPSGEPNPSGDRAALARLRRAATPLDALAEPATLELYRRLGFGAGEIERRLPWVAVAAMVLAQVRSEPRHAEGEAAASPAARVGRRSLHGDFVDAAMKPLRFRRLLSAREPEELARELRRLVQLAGGEADVGQLATAVIDWADEQRGERLRTRWAYDYYGAGGAAPAGEGAAEAAAPARPPAELGGPS